MFKGEPSETPPEVTSDRMLAEDVSIVILVNAPIILNETKGTQCQG